MRSTAAMISGLWFLIASSGAATAQLREGTDAFGDWRLDKPGTIRLITPKDLPAPGATPSAANVSRVVAKPANAKLRVPPGFRIELFADGLNGPRILRVAPNGDIFVAETYKGSIRILRAADGASKPDTNEVFAAGLNRPFGIAFFPNGDNQQ
jgi:glucose/arabinose dehydrogenase